MTDKGRRFMQEFASRFTPPRDWGQKARDENTSTLPMWLDWIDRERTSPDIVFRVLDQYHKQDKRPTLADVKRAYNMMAGRTGAGGGFTPRDLCEVCDDSGVVIVANVEIRGREYMVDRPGPYRELFTRSVPCKCSTGQRINNRTDHCTPGMLDRAFRCRLAPMRFYDLQRECKALVESSGGAEDDNAALPDDPERDGVYVNAEDWA